MDGRKRRHAPLSFSNRAAKVREEVLPAVDKFFLVSEQELVIYYTHRSPVTITGKNAMALYSWLITPNPPSADMERVYQAGMETTAKVA